jgi:hypothetical protein
MVHYTDYEMYVSINLVLNVTLRFIFLIQVGNGLGVCVFPLHGTDFSCGMKSKSEEGDS